MEKLIEAVEEYPAGSCAPNVVSIIYAMKDVSMEGKRAMAAIFLAAYRGVTGSNAQG